MTVSFRRIIIIAIAAIVIVAGAATWKYLSSRAASDELVLSGTVEADEIHIGSKVGGRIAEVLVREGQTVKRGDVILKFESFDLDAKRADAAAAVAQAEANLERFVNGSRPEEIAQARAQAEAARMNFEMARNGPRRQEIDAARAELNAAEADFEIARSSLARIEQLTRSGVTSRQDYDSAKSAFDRAAARREAARQRLSLLEAGTRSEEIERAERQYKQAQANSEMVERGSRREDVAAARAAVERARASLQQIETQLGELEVRSPADSFIEVLQVRPGDLINPNSPVATLVEVDRLWVRVYVSSPERGHAQLGKEVAVYVDTFGKEAFTGRIEHISNRGEFTPRNVQTRDERAHQVFAVRVRVDNSSGRLGAGMAADVVIKKNE